MSAKSKIPEEFTFTWRIENYSSCYQKPGEYIRSPVFAVESFSGGEGYFMLFPRGTPNYHSYIRGTPNYHNYIACTLYTENIDWDEQAMRNLIIDIISADGEILESRKCENVINVGRETVSVPVADFIKIDDLMKKMENCKEDTLTIRYCFKVNETRKRKATRCEVKTRIGVDRYSFQWNVAGINSSNWSKSKKILFPMISQIEITLTAPEDALFINIQKTEENPKVFRFVICRVSLLDVEGVERYSKKYTHLFDIENVVSSWEFPSFITKTQLNSEGHTFLKHGTFTLMCELSISTGLQSEIYVDRKSEISSPVNVSPPIDTFSNLKEDLRCIFTSKTHSDVELQVEGDIFPAHKSLLAARSPVFSAMFDQDMLESQTGIVDILDMDAETLNSFLSFVYTGTVDKMDYEIALKLLVAAEKYQVESLKEKCASFLTIGLSNENACEVLVVADMVEHKLLKESVQDFIKARAEKILPSPEWSQWIEKNVRLASEILSSLSVEFGSLANEELVHHRYGISSSVNVGSPMDDAFLSLKKDLRSMFANDKYSDVKLRVGGDIFPTHKSLLAARSPVFSAMFDQDMLESQTGVVDIPDMNAETLNSFLSFLYTGAIDKMDYEVTLKLLVAAEKYQVESLMKKCVSFLKSGLSDGNACEVLVVADMVEHKLLKESVQNYIKARARKILPSREWSQCIEKNIRLANEILSKMSVEFASSEDEPSDTEEE